MLDKQYSIEQHLNVNPVFKTRDIFSDSFIPTDVLYRHQQMEKVGQLFASPLRNESPGKIICVGMPGTGKSLVIRFWIKELLEGALRKGRQDVKVLLVNFALERSLPSAMHSLCRQYGINKPDNGLSHTDYIEAIMNKATANNDYLLIVMDEVDCLFKKKTKEAEEVANSLLYGFLRVNTLFAEHKLGLVFITNDSKVEDYFNAKNASSFSASKVHFPRYDAEQIKGILVQRANAGFQNDVIVQEAAFNFISSVIAQESGDARKAVALLLQCGNAIERKGSRVITEEVAIQMYEESEVHALEMELPTLPFHHQTVFLSVLINESQSRKRDANRDLHAFTLAQLYSTYCMLLKRRGGEPLSDRRFQDIINDLNEGSLLSTEVRSFGKGKGRAKMVSLTSPFEPVARLVKKLTRLGKWDWGEDINLE